MIDREKWAHPATVVVELEVIEPAHDYADIGDEYLNDPEPSYVLAMQAYREAAMAAAFYGEDDAIIARYAKQAADAYKHIPAPERMRGVNSLLV